MVHLDRITIYPIKALDGLDLAQVTVRASGALDWDRRLAIVDAEGRTINGKRTERVHAIRTEYDLEAGRIVLKREGRDGRAAFPLSDLGGLSGWFSDHFEMPVRMVENVEAGWPDDTDAPGPTVIGVATQEVVAGWFPGLTISSVRRRFRANLELGGVEPFWEDRLYGEPGQAVRFRIGKVELEGVNPCQRCVVPTRSPVTGEVIPGFQKMFAERRKDTLPPWAAAARFNHFYRLAVNTRPVPDGAGVLRVGDEVTILG